jgi:hypothetical protein
MIDKTTEGVTAEPEEVEAVLHNLCGYHLSEPNPVFRYTALTREQVLYDALVAAIKRERGRALAELVASGVTLTQVADMTTLRTRQRVQRLIAVAKAAEAAAAQLQAASREFEDRLAAVEATLDEVVSGIPPADLPVQRDPLDDRGGRADVDVDALLEDTRSLPTLAASLSPTKELSTAKELSAAKDLGPIRTEEPPWWRRNRTDGRESDTGAA